jgi:hypothetical protein
MDTSLTPTMYYVFVLHATAWLDRGKEVICPQDLASGWWAPMPQAGPWTGIAELPQDGLRRHGTFGRIEAILDEDERIVQIDE